MIGPIITPSAEWIFSFPYLTHLATGITVHTGIIDERRIVVIARHLGTHFALSCQSIARMLLAALVASIGVDRA